MKQRILPHKLFTRQKVGLFAADQLYCFIGCCCYAAAINVFIVPNQLAQSGISGIAILINHLFGVYHIFPWAHIGMINLALNVPLVVLALLFLGWRFVSKTLFLIVELSLIIDLMPKLLPFTYKNEGDLLLAAVLAGALSGFGQALIFTRGATSGGSDIIGWLVRKRWPQVSIGRALMIFNGGVVLAGAFVFRHVNAALYAAIMIFISSRVIDGMLYGMNNGKMFYIFSAKAEQIAQAVIDQLSRGASILPARGAFTGNENSMLMCVVHRNEVTQLRRIVREHDPQSFMVIAEAQEIFGQGFKGHE